MAGKFWGPEDELNEEWEPEGWEEEIDPWQDEAWPEDDFLDERR
ncbi:MAG: hypothetical protein ACRCYV_04400 [Aeromonas sp.]